MNGGEQGGQTVYYCSEGEGSTHSSLKEKKRWGRTLAVRRGENSQGGTTEFWQRAKEREVSKSLNSGYTKIGRRERIKPRTNVGG